MTLQSAIGSNVTVIAGILVCIVISLPIGLSLAPWSCVLYFCICEYFEKLTKLVTWRKNSDRRNLSVDLYYGDHGYSTCATRAGSLMKRQKREGGFSAQFWGVILFSMDSYYRDITCSKCITKSFVIYPDNDLQA